MADIGGSHRTLCALKADDELARVIEQLGSRRRELEIAWCSDKKRNASSIFQIADGA